MNPTDIEKIIDSFKYLNDDSSTNSGSIFVAPLNHLLTKKLFKKNLQQIHKDGWKTVKGTKNSEGFKAYFADHSLKEKKQIFHLDHIGSEAIRKSVTNKMFPGDNDSYDKAVIESIENSGTMFELSSQPDQNFLNTDLYFETDYYQGERYYFTLDYVHLWLFNTGIGMLCFKAKLIRVENKESGVSDTSTLAHIARFNRCLRSFENIEGNTRFFTYEHTQIAQGHFFKDIILDKWLSNGPDESSTVLGLTANAKGKLLDKQYSHMKVFTWATLNPRSGNEQWDINKELIWEMPYMWPKPDTANIVNDLSDKNWTPLASSMHYAIMEGYPSVKDYFLYEFAETGDSLSAYNSNHIYAVNPEYLKYILQNQHIEMYAEKDGLATNESLAFISTRTPELIDVASVPPNWQSNIYPLYILQLHVHEAINKFENVTTDAYKAPERYLQQIKDFQMFRNSFWFHQYGNKAQDKIVASKIDNALNIDARFNHLEKEMQEVANSIVQATQQIKTIVFTTTLILLYPIWLWIDANQILDELKIYYTEDPYESLGITFLALFLIQVFLVIFNKPIKTIISLIWSKMLSIRYYNE